MTSPTISLTFGDVGENGPGMQRLGVEAKEGFSIDDLQTIKLGINTKYPKAAGKNPKLSKL